MELLVGGIESGHGAELHFVPSQILGERAHDAFHVTGRDDDPRDEVHPAGRVQDPIQNEFFAAVRDEEIVAEMSPGHFIARGYLDLLPWLRR
jgi:hypothetical protein